MPIRTVELSTRSKMTRDPPIAFLGKVAAHAVMYYLFCIARREGVFNHDIHV